ncbi:hypothetical protein GOV10_05225 [Candidatus Woesearchaeota archaeon]|nr:hypothetical protein [Candidatus Woesearchaeota archaeon]
MWLSDLFALLVLAVFVLALLLGIGWCAETFPDAASSVEELILGNESEEALQEIVDSFTDTNVRSTPAGGHIDNISSTVVEKESNTED